MEFHPAEQTKLKQCFLFGFTALFLCGIGDWLISYEPAGGLPLLYGITSTSIIHVPSWFYLLSMAFGILSGFGCMVFAPAMKKVIRERALLEDQKAVRLFEFGLASTPMMFVSFHTACCMVLLMIQAALRAGISPQAADSVFFVPAAASLFPFLIWCYLCDIPITIAWMYFVIRGRMNLPNYTALFSPMGMSLLFKIPAVILVKMHSPYAFLASSGESWGYAVLCLAFYWSLSFREKGKPIPADAESGQKYSCNKSGEG